MIPCSILFSTSKDGPLHLQQIILLFIFRVWCVAIIVGGAKRYWLILCLWQVAVDHHYVVKKCYLSKIVINHTLFFSVWGKLHPHSNFKYLVSMTMRFPDILLYSRISSHIGPALLALWTSGQVVFWTSQVKVLVQSMPLHCMFHASRTAQYIVAGH